MYYFNGEMCMIKLIKSINKFQLLAIIGSVILGIGIICLCIKINSNDNGIIDEETLSSSSVDNLLNENTEETQTVIADVYEESDTEKQTSSSESLTETEEKEQSTSVEESKENVVTETKTTKVNTTKVNTTTKKPQSTEETENPTKFINADISAYINKSGNTVTTRIKAPKNFTRVEYEAGSYADYIKNLPLEPHGTKLYEYDGTISENQTWYAAVIKTEFHSRGWLQCADCIMKLISDYLYDNGRSKEIVFDLASGKRMYYSKWKGSYDKYLTEVYYSANTLSFMNQKESKRLSLDKIFPGAYFIMAKDSKHEYGHAVYVIDVAKNTKTGEIAFLLAQGSTPSQVMNIFLNPLHPNDPWYYSSEIGSTFPIPFWEFNTKNLYYYEPIGIQKGIVVEETQSETVSITETTTEKIDETTTETSVEQEMSSSNNVEETTSVGNNIEETSSEEETTLLEDNSYTEIN